jgi:PIN domain nuclease of toxin-antitoxin system
MRGGGFPEALLLDTCAVIWLQNEAEMTKSAVEAILRAGQTGDVLISPVSAWEIGLMTRPGTRQVPGPQFLPDPKTWFQRTMNAPGVGAAPFTPEIAIDASHLPGEVHNDPADRLLIATARHLGVPIVTRDRRIVDYGRAGYVSVISC